MKKVMKAMTELPGFEVREGCKRIFGVVLNHRFSLLGAISIPLAITDFNPIIV